MEFNDQLNNLSREVSPKLFIITSPLYSAPEGFAETFADQVDAQLIEADKVKSDFSDVMTQTLDSLESGNDTIYNRYLYKDTQRRELIHRTKVGGFSLVAFNIQTPYRILRERVNSEIQRNRSLGLPARRSKLEFDQKKSYGQSVKPSISEGLDKIVVFSGAFDVDRVVLNASRALIRQGIQLSPSRR